MAASVQKASQAPECLPQRHDGGEKVEDGQRRRARRDAPERQQRRPGHEAAIIDKPALPDLQGREEVAAIPVPVLGDEEDARAGEPPDYEERHKVRKAAFVHAAPASQAHQGVIGDENSGRQTGAVGMERKIS